MDASLSDKAESGPLTAHVLVVIVTPAPSSARCAVQSKPCGSKDVGALSMRSPGARLMSCLHHEEPLSTGNDDPSILSRHNHPFHRTRLIGIHSQCGPVQTQRARTDRNPITD